MYSQEMLILAVVIAVFIGLLVGLLLSRTFFPGAAKNDRRELEAARSELLNYKADVAEHLLLSSRKLKAIDKHQREIKDHLAKSAIKLTSPQQSRELIRALENDESDAERDTVLLDGPTTVDHDDLDQPKDYAPKQPGEKGTLREEYGLKPTDDSVVEAPKL